MAFNNKNKLKLSFSTAYIITNDTNDFSGKELTDLIHIPYDVTSAPSIKFEYDSSESNSNTFGMQLADFDDKRLRATLTFPNMQIEKASTLDDMKKTAFHNILGIAFTEQTDVTDGDGNVIGIEYKNSDIHNTSFGKIFTIEDDEIHIVSNAVAKITITDNFDGKTFVSANVEIYGIYEVYPVTDDTTSILKDTTPKKLREEKFLADTVGERIKEISNVKIGDLTPALNSVEISDGRGLTFDFTSINDDNIGVEAITNSSKFTIKVTGKIHNQFVKPDFTSLETVQTITGNIGDRMTFEMTKAVIDPATVFTVGNEDNFKNLDITYMGLKDPTNKNIKFTFTEEE